MAYSNPHYLDYLRTSKNCLEEALRKQEKHNYEILYCATHLMGLLETADMLILRNSIE